jgi:hypothetical protein
MLEPNALVIVCEEGLLKREAAALIIPERDNMVVFKYYNRIIATTDTRAEFNVI